VRGERLELTGLRIGGNRLPRGYPDITGVLLVRQSRKRRWWHSPANFLDGHILEFRCAVCAPASFSLLVCPLSGRYTRDVKQFGHGHIIPALCGDAGEHLHMRCERLRLIVQTTPRAIGASTPHHLHRHFQPMTLLLDNRQGANLKHAGHIDEAPPCYRYLWPFA
jgi:hypothetical protein